MPNPKTVLLLLLAVLGVGFVFRWIELERHRGQRPKLVPSSLSMRALVGAITDFLDTRGVGSFATTSSFYRLGRMVRDEDIPGTLNVGHALPTLAQAFIYIAIIEVDVVTLSTMIAAAVLGGHIGAGIVTNWPRRRIQLGMALVLVAAAVIIALRELQWIPGGGTARGLSHLPLLLGVGGNLVLGALMTLGIGLYAPCMILVSLLSMHPQAAFPIMMGSCAFLMPVASVEFIRKRRYDLGAALGLTLGGVPAVLVAAYFVRSLPVTVVQWLVVLVALYTAATLLHAWRRRA